MPTYYLQKFENTANGGDTICYGVEDSHDHARSNQFSIDVLTWLVNKAHWRRNQINQKKFFSGQPKPKSGKEFKWDNEFKKWVQV